MLSVCLVYARSMDTVYIVYAKGMQNKKDTRKCLSKKFILKINKPKALLIRFQIFALANIDLLMIS